MDYNFTKRISRLKASTIREMLKARAPDVVSFSAGSPSPETFPVSEMADIAASIFGAQAIEALQYGITEGYEPLRELTKARLKNNFNIGTDDDDLIILTGGQQGIDLSVKMLVNDGDTVICEDPSFIGALNAFRSYDANLAGVPMDDEGMDLNALENVLKSDPRAKMIYTIPTFHNPMGITMPIGRRRALLELSVKYGVPIVEDNPYCELRYKGEHVPSIKSLDTTGNVIYLGSYSKTISPAIRIGFVCAPKELITKMTVLKQVADVHTNQFFQIVVAKYLQEYDMDKHVSLCCKFCAGKLDRMLSRMDRSFPDYVKFTRPEGGLFIWCSLPDGFDGAEFAQRALANKVAIVPGSTFLTTENTVSSSFRLNFTMPSMEQIDLGIDILGDTIRNFVEKA